MMSTVQSIMMAFLRPSRSARLREVVVRLGGTKAYERSRTHEAPIRAPHRVPMESIPTMRPVRTLENEQLSTTPGVEQLAKRSLKSSCGGASYGQRRRSKSSSVPAPAERTMTRKSEI